MGEWVSNKEAIGAQDLTLHHILLILKLQENVSTILGVLHE